MSEGQKYRRRGWRSHVNELLKHLHRGPVVTPSNLQSLQLTLRTPTPIVPLSAVTEQFPLFLDSREGKDWIYSREQMICRLEESDSELEQDNFGRFTASMIMNSAERKG